MVKKNRFLYIFVSVWNRCVVMVILISNLENLSDDVFFDIYIFYKFGCKNLSCRFWMLDEVEVFGFWDYV